MQGIAGRGNHGATELDSTFRRRHHRLGQAGAIAAGGKARAPIPEGDREARIDIDIRERRHHWHTRSRRRDRAEAERPAIAATACGAGTTIAHIDQHLARDGAQIREAQNRPSLPARRSGPSITSNDLITRGVVIAQGDCVDIAAARANPTVPSIEARDVKGRLCGGANVIDIPTWRALGHGEAIQVALNIVRPGNAEAEILPGGCGAGADGTDGGF